MIKQILNVILLVIIFSFSSLAVNDVSVNSTGNSTSVNITETNYSLLYGQPYQSNLTISTGSSGLTNIIATFNSKVNYTGSVLNARILRDNVVLNTYNITSLTYFQSNSFSNIVYDTEGTHTYSMEVSITPGKNATIRSWNLSVFYLNTGSYSGSFSGTTDNVSEGTTNLYFTDLRAINSTQSIFDSVNSTKLNITDYYNSSSDILNLQNFINETFIPFTNTSYLKNSSVLCNGNMTCTYYDNGSLLLTSTSSGGSGGITLDEVNNSAQINRSQVINQIDIDTYQNNSGVSVNSIGNLTDVAIFTPISNDFLMFNGLFWVNNPIVIPASAGSAVTFFLEETNSDIATYKTLQKSFPSSLPESEEFVVVNNNEQLLDSYASNISGIGLTSISAGIWEFDTYTKVNVTGNSKIIIDVYKRFGTEEFLLFSTETGVINHTEVELHTNIVVEPTFIINTTDRLVIKYTGNTTNAYETNISLFHGGNNYYSHLHTPIIPIHNELGGLQGCGNSTDCQHISIDEKNRVPVTETLSNKSTDIGLGTSNDLYPTQNATKSYIDEQISILVFNGSIEATIMTCGDVCHNNHYVNYTAYANLTADFITNSTMDKDLNNFTNTPGFINSSFNLTYDNKISLLEINDTQDRAYVNDTFEPLISVGSANYFLNGSKVFVELTASYISDFTASVQSIIDSGGYVTNTTVDKDLSNYTNTPGFITSNFNVTYDNSTYKYAQWNIFNVSTGNKGKLMLPSGTIVEAYVSSTEAGNITVNFWKGAFGNNTLSTANSIGWINMTNNYSVVDTTLSEFTTTNVVSRDMLIANVYSTDGLVNVTFGLTIRS